MVVAYRSFEVMPQRWIVRVSPEPPALGETLKRLREERGISQGHMARQLGISQTTLSGWETSNYKAPNEAVRQLATAYGVSSRDLFRIQAEHELWEKNYEPVPADAIAMPDEPAIEVLADKAAVAESEHIIDVAELLGILNGELTPELKAMASAAISILLRRGPVSDEDLAMLRAMIEEHSDEQHA